MNDLRFYFNWYQGQLHLTPGITSIITVIALAGLASALLAWMYARFKPKFSTANENWRLILFEAIYAPSYCLIWLLVLFYLLHAINTAQLMSIDKAHLYLFQLVVLSLWTLWFACRYVSRIERILLQRRYDRRESRATIRSISQIARAVLIIIIALVIVQGFGVPISGLLAFGGAGGIVIGFAGRDMLANLFGGLMLFWDRPFAEGDWIRSPDREIEGVVEHIGWRHTTMRTFDKRPLYLPNSIFLTIAVENPSRMKNRRIKAVFGLRYADATKVDTVVKAIKEMLKQREDIDQKQLTLVCMVEFGASTLDILLYTFTVTVDWATFQEVQQKVFLEVLRVITEHGAECAFPTRTLEVPDPLMEKISQ